MAALEVLVGLVLQGYVRHRTAFACLDPFADTAGIGKMGELAKRIKDNQRHWTVAHAGDQYQTVAGLIGEAGLGQLDVPVGAIDQMIGVGEAQSVVGLAKGHGFSLVVLNCVSIGYLRAA